MSFTFLGSCLNYDILEYIISMFLNEANFEN